MREPTGSLSASLYGPGRSSGKERGKRQTCLEQNQATVERNGARDEVQERLSNVWYRRKASTRGFKLRMTRF